MARPEDSFSSPKEYQDWVHKLTEKSISFGHAYIRALENPMKLSGREKRALKKIGNTLQSLRIFARLEPEVAAQAAQIQRETLLVFEHGLILGEETITVGGVFNVLNVLSETIQHQSGDYSKKGKKLLKSLQTTLSEPPDEQIAQAPAGSHIHYLSDRMKRIAA